MGKFRHVPIWIVHDDSKAQEDCREKCALVARLCRIEPGKLAINEQKLHFLMEQINAIRIEVKDQQ